MTEVADLRLPNAERLFEAYVAAATKAKATQDLQDGLAAGRAWSAFLDAFVPPERRLAEHVIPFRPGVPRGRVQ